MPKINPDAKQEVADRLNLVYRTQAKGSDQLSKALSEALNQHAWAAAHLALSLASAVGPGVGVLADMLVDGEHSFIGRLSQIAELVNGELDDFFKATLFDYGREGMAIIFLIRTDDGLEFRIMVSRSASQMVMTAAETRARELAEAFGLEFLPVYRAGDDDSL